MSKMTAQEIEYRIPHFTGTMNYYAYRSPLTGQIMVAALLWQKAI